MKHLLMATLVAGTLAGCGTMSSMMDKLHGDAAPAKTVDGVLVGPNGMSLYTFDRDVAGSGRSACVAACATNWPPLAAPPDAKPTGDWSVIAREDGSRQWAYRGKPVYYWTRDTKAGDRTGDGFNNVWKLARP